MQLDKPRSFNDLVTVLKIIRRQLWIVCTLALLAMAGGQVVHACAELQCHLEAGTEEHTTCPDEQDGPDGHCCCNASSCMSSILPDPANNLFLAADVSGPFLILNETCGDGPCRDIDHPPQLA